MKTLPHLCGMAYGGIEQKELMTVGTSVNKIAPKSSWAWSESYTSIGTILCQFKILPAVVCVNLAT